MDESVRQAMAKWPNVPALYGWLGLDEHGHWLLRGEPIEHAGLIAFIDRNYTCDDDGAWFFQNGPQRGYVDLAYTPWVAHADATGTLRTHTGAVIESISAAYVDDTGGLVLATEHGPAAVDADNLAVVCDWLRNGDDRAADADALEAAVRGEGAALSFAYGAGRAPLAPIAREQVPAFFGFERRPSEGGDH